MLIRRSGDRETPNEVVEKAFPHLALSTRNRQDHAIRIFEHKHSMARYKTIDTNPRFLAVDLARQLLPGTFEHALNHLLDHELDLSDLDARYRNDETGAPAYPPAVL
ncbi:MAG TPA: hypothetical protein VM532_10370, partial [Burkholderiales bacterium]|nr:hypothetical protein [Burkholderiales bacterium]